MCIICCSVVWIDTAKQMNVIMLNVMPDVKNEKKKKTYSNYFDKVWPLSPTSSIYATSTI
jgi:hypothetical protein